MTAPPAENVLPTPLRHRIALASGVALAAALLALAALRSAEPAGAPASAPPASGSSAVSSAISGLPLYFIENRGQVDRAVDYYVEGERTSVYFGRHGLNLSMPDGRSRARRFGLRLDFLGARAGARPVGRTETGAEVNYFKGRPAQWRTGIRTYAAIGYRDLWPGIDLVYAGRGGRLKYSFLVRPGANPAAIRVGWRGAKGLGIGRGGQLQVSTPAGRLVDDAPYAYQRVGRRRVPVDASYALAGGHSYGFRLRGYDRSRPLVIDPAALVYAGYIGGSDDDGANNVAVDRKGSLYVVGTTSSPKATFPDKVGPDRTFNGVDDAFVAKVDPSGRRLVYASYIGGDRLDSAIGVALDGTGAAYVSGTTGSTEASFPARVGPDVTYNGGPLDAFIAKVSPSGRRLMYAGYIGGAAPTPPGTPNEQANGVAVDRRGNAYVAGFTPSPAFAGFPATPGSFDPSHNGLVDTFLVKVGASGRRFVYGGYIGGAGVDPGTGISVDRAGNAYVNGFTGSSEATFPDGDGFGPVRGFDRSFNGNPLIPAPNDAYVGKVNAAGSALAYATYIGGAGVDQPFGNALDRRGNLYLTGYTGSTQATFPDGDGFGRVPGFDHTFGGGRGTVVSDVPSDAFVAKLDRSGTRLLYATYVGGSDDEMAVAIDVDRRGSAHISGGTASRQATFPVRGGPDRTYNGGPEDAFVAKLSPSGNRLSYAGYIGGRGRDEGIGVAVDGAGSAYVSGATDSSRASFPDRGGPDRSENGLEDAFVAKISTRSCLRRRPTIVGTRGNDTIVGTRRRDVIVALGGRDVIRSGGGSDLICAGGGSDRISAGSGADTLDGGSGRDRCDGGPANDRARRCESRRRIP